MSMIIKKIDSMQPPIFMANSQTVHDIGSMERFVLLHIKTTSGTFKLVYVWVVFLNHKFCKIGGGIMGFKHCRNILSLLDSVLPNLEMHKFILNMT